MHHQNGKLKDEFSFSKLFKPLSEMGDSLRHLIQLVLLASLQNTIFFHDLSFKFLISLLMSSFIFKIHPVCVEPLPKEKCKNGENGGDRYKNSDERIFNDDFHSPLFVVKGRFVLINNKRWSWNVPRLGLG